MNKNKLFGIALILLIAVLLVVRWQILPTKNQIPSEENPTSAINIVKDTKLIDSSGPFSFKLVSRDVGDKYPDLDVEIYKDGQFMKKVTIRYSFSFPSFFIVSPDNKHAAFESSYAGGTCVYGQTPTILDLETFSIVSTSTVSKTIDQKLSSRGIESTTRHITNLNWLSNSALEADMKFGESGGPNDNCILPRGIDSFSDKLLFTL